MGNSPAITSVGNNAGTRAVHLEYIGYLSALVPATSRPVPTFTHLPRPLIYPASRFDRGSGAIGNRAFHCAEERQLESGSVSSGRSAKKLCGNYAGDPAIAVQANDGWSDELSFENFPKRLQTIENSRFELVFFASISQLFYGLDNGSDHIVTEGGGAGQGKWLLHTCETEGRNRLAEPQPAD
jgi:hypothetical protein